MKYSKSAKSWNQSKAYYIGPVFSHVCIPLPTAFSIGVHDSSGMEFFYTSSPREFDAGILYLGDQVGINEVVPPNAVDYQIFGWCPSECTDKVCSHYKNQLKETETMY